LCGSGRNRVPLAEAEVETATEYACENADVVLRLEERLREELDRHALTDLFRDLEMPLIQVLADMETAGIAIDQGFFRELQAKLDKELRLIEE
ncbi:MAG: DNA polymerase I, partial [Gemmatimonadetes bacterium]|nr:DNA polymerase I [Gemmatimonadota bacterium]NIW38698.1 DNA polymerase I [Gemmatimonadota bacterium]